MGKKSEIEKQLELLIQGNENEVVEFKEAKNNFDFRKLGKYFSALCNEANLNEQSSAWLVFGIRDKDKKVVGSEYRNNSVKTEGLSFLTLASLYPKMLKK